MEMISIKILFNQMNIASDLVIRSAHIYCPPHTKRCNRTELNGAVLRGLQLPAVRGDHELFLLKIQISNRRSVPLLGVRGFVTGLQYVVHQK